MSELNEDHEAGTQLLHAATTALTAARRMVDVYEQMRRARQAAADRADRAQEKVERARETAQRQIEREQRQADRAKREQRELEREQRNAARDKGQRETKMDKAADPDHARDLLAARWAAAEALRLLDPESAQAWDAVMREAGVDTDQVRALADAATAQRRGEVPNLGAETEVDGPEAQVVQLTLDIVEEELDRRADETAADKGDLLQINDGAAIGDALDAANHGSGTGTSSSTTDPTTDIDAGRGTGIDEEWIAAL